MRFFFFFVATEGMSREVAALNERGDVPLVPVVATTAVKQKRKVIKPVTKWYARARLFSVLRCG